jgi:hypothetical protein
MKKHIPTTGDAKPQVEVSFFHLVRGLWAISSHLAIFPYFAVLWHSFLSFPTVSSHRGYIFLGGEGIE